MDFTVQMDKHNRVVIVNQKNYTDMEIYFKDVDQMDEMLPVIIQKLIGINES